MGKCSLAQLFRLPRLNSKTRLLSRGETKPLASRCVLDQKRSPPFGSLPTWVSRDRRIRTLRFAPTLLCFDSNTLALPPLKIAAVGASPSTGSAIRDAGTTTAVKRCFGERRIAGKNPPGRKGLFPSRLCRPSERALLRRIDDVAAMIVKARVVRSSFGQFAFVSRSPQN
jgi:hypothetical protein